MSYEVEVFRRQLCNGAPPGQVRKLIDGYLEAVAAMDEPDQRERKQTVAALEEFRAGVLGGINPESETQPTLPVARKDAIIEDAESVLSGQADPEVREYPMGMIRDLRDEVIRLRAQLWRYGDRSWIKPKTGA